MWKNYSISRELLTWIIIVISLLISHFSASGQIFFGFLPQKYLDFFDFQIQSNNIFSLKRFKKKRLWFGGYFGIFYMGILCN